MWREVFDSEGERSAERAAAREWYLEALRAVCDVYAEALTPEQRAGLASVCPLEPCCGRSRRRRRRRARRELSENFAVLLEAVGEQLLPPPRE